ncbi:hypothetical protein DSO57_1027687 [Entomophthora muscae]|uniref:Uncharacterized protein n=1 Tax=Entomophthora muscae TaxID=34485 RepID=A0ACC2RSK0_9FUNG|nr:hypothetical protein DSO57_1027687 [Entomophthora muscae]
MIPGVWYTTTPLFSFPPVMEKQCMFMSNTKALTPTLFHPLALDFLLSYLEAYFFPGRFNPLLGRYYLLGDIFHMGMVSVPIGTLVTGLNLSAVIHNLGGMFPSGWVSDTYGTHEALSKNLHSLSNIIPPPTLNDKIHTCI